MKRRISREGAIQLLYGIDINPHRNLKEDCLSFSISSEDPFLLQILNGVSENKDRIDLAIGSKLNNWTVDRLSWVDLSCLRAGGFEILFLNQDKAIVINEYVEIAKKFGETDSAGFIHGVLNAL